MTDLSVDYLGLKLKNPVIVGASGMTSDPVLVSRIGEVGAAAVVCKSLFEEEINLESLQFEKDLHEYDDINAEMITIRPQLKFAGPAGHLRLLENIKKTAGIPVIGSLNAVHDEIWLEYTEKMEKTGIDALELNFYSSHDLPDGDIGDREKSRLELIKKIRDRVRIPLSVKLSPYYSDIFGFVRKLDKIGINGFVLFNRFFHTDIDIERQIHTYPFTFGKKEDNRLPLRYAGLLFNRIKGSVACSSGITDHEDVVKMLLAGASAVQVVTTLYKNGISGISRIVSGLEDYMKRKRFGTIADFRGNLSRDKLKDRDIWIYKRTQYVKMLMQAGESLAEKIF
jgi:dihydroorotate dehydrogenase (fumarate)